MFLIILRVVIVCISLLWVATSFATANLTPSPTIGEFATSLMEPVSILNKFMNTACMMLGIMCLFSALLRYMQYRVNRVAMPLGSVMLMFVLGLLFLALPFVYLITGHNPFS